MEQRELKATLRQLHDELEATGSADPELKDLLRELDSDIHRLTEQHAPLGQRLEQAAASFEAEHPRVASLLTDLADTLAKLGL